jgi:hypothetical protein
MNRKFMFSIALLMSLILGPGFAVASQIAMAVIITYPYTNTLYDNAYNSIDDPYSSSYGNSEYDYAYYNKNNNNNTNDDKYSDSYSKPSNAYNNNNNNNNNNDSNDDSNDDKYSDSYSKSDYSKYPTKDKLYKCQKGPFEGFFTSSVEFCIAANSNTT